MKLLYLLILIKKKRESAIKWFPFSFFSPAVLPASSPIDSTAERIVGGGSAIAGQFPFIVSLRTVSSNKHFCGGTIHSSRYVLTAAHCVDKQVSLNVKVVTGAVLLSSGGSSYSVTTITMHPNYNAYTYLNDVAVIRTASSIVFMEQVQPIPITSNFVDNNLNTVAVGWGMTTVRNYYSNEPL